jgi:hypothetical protein
MSEWISVDDMQPNIYENVLWYCEGGNIRTGMYYGIDFCKSIPESHGMFNKHRKFYGKYGRYAEPASLGYKSTLWMPLPAPPIA